MNGEEKLKSINEALAMGSTILITNYMHCWKITTKTVEKFKKRGLDVLKVKNDELYMMSGKKHVCIAGCRIEAIK